MTIVQIKRRFTGAVLYECDVPDDVASGMRTRHALEAANKARADLARANLARAYLADANLTGAYLAGADLADADLAGADLAGANLADADLAGANLADADLAGADLAGADLARAYLADANLADANLARANLTGAYLAGADLADADLAGADLAGADLARADLARAYLADANLADANLAGADLARANRTTDEQAIANLDKVREIILDNKARLDMSHWHDANSDWEQKTCAEEALCETTHCLAGWLQVCATDPKVRAMNAQLAGIVQAPIASKMFFRPEDEVLSWLDERKYVADIAEANERRAARKAAKEGA